MTHTTAPARAPDDRTRDLKNLLAFALRHRPDRFGLVMAGDGFAPLAPLLRALGRTRTYSDLSTEALRHLVVTLDAERFEVRGEFIRARYGHSHPVPDVGDVAEPPAVLFHGTSDDAFELIWKHGLYPMGRHFLHLTTDRGYATRVGVAKGIVCVWTVNAREAFCTGIPFRRANRHIWLTNEIPPCFLAVEPVEPAEASVATAQLVV